MTVRGDGAPGPHAEGNAPRLTRRPARLDGAEVDVAVVGGGIFGVCVAWDAALRGLSVALLERGDFGHATSANHFKVAHGGIRYLQHLDVVRARRSSRERSALLRIAPHLVAPLPILMPAFGHGRRGVELLRLGCRLHDLLTADRNRGIDDPSRRIPSSRRVSPRDVREAFPALDRPDLTGGSVFYDGQIYNPPRLALAFVKSAAAAGARVLNYAEVDGFLRDSSRVTGVEARDRLSGRKLEVRAGVVVNAAGPWAPRLVDDLLDVPGGPSPARFTFSRDVALVVRRQLHPGMGVAVPASTRDADAVLDRGARHLFFLPWRRRTLVGVWHRVYRAPPDRVEVTGEEVERYLQEANRAYPGLDLDTSDVCQVNAGLVLFGDPDDQPEDGHAFGKRSAVVDHQRDHGLGGLVTVVGVRATAARRVASEVVDVAERQLDAPTRPAPTDTVPLAGAHFDSFASLAERIGGVTGLDPGSRRCLSLARNYGSEFPHVWSLVDEVSRDAGRADGPPSLTRAEILHAIRREMAVTLEDVLLRRTEIGTACPPDEAAIEAAAELLVHELGRDGDRVAEEVAEMRAFFGRRGAIRRYGDAAPTAPSPA